MRTPRKSSRLSTDPRCHQQTGLSIIQCTGSSAARIGFTSLGVSERGETTDLFRSAHRDCLSCMMYVCLLPLYVHHTCMYECWKFVKAIKLHGKFPSMHVFEPYQHNWAHCRPCKADGMFTPPDQTMLQARSTKLHPKTTPIIISLTVEHTACRWRFHTTPSTSVW